MPLGASRFGLLGGVADLGKLELIETQSYSGAVSYVDFTSIQESTYNVHFMTYNNFASVSSNNVSFGIQLYESGILETGSVYQYAQQRGTTGGTFTEIRSITSVFMFLGHTATGGGVGQPQNGYCYLYNLGDSTKYSFGTNHSFNTDSFAGAGSVMNTQFGSNVLPQASTVNGIRITTSSAIDIGSFDISLYGIRYS